MGGGGKESSALILKYEAQEHMGHQMHDEEGDYRKII